MTDVVKDLYELGETPPRGHVPKQMYAGLVRQSRFGEPRQAFAGAVSKRLNPLNREDFLRKTTQYGRCVTRTRPDFQYPLVSAKT